MKTVRKIFLGFLALVAYTAIAISGKALRERPPELTTSALVYVVLLVASVIYFHWLFRAFLMPFSGLSKEEQAALLNRALGQYRIGFFAGTIGFGYFCLALYVFGFFHDLPDKSDVPNFTMGAIFFIGLGVLARARGLILSLIKPESNEEGKIASEPAASTNDNSTDQPGSPEVTQPPSSLPS